MICDKDAIKSVDSLPIRANLKNRVTPAWLYDSTELTPTWEMAKRTISRARVSYKSPVKSDARTRRKSREERKGNADLLALAGKSIYTRTIN